VYNKVGRVYRITKMEKKVVEGREAIPLLTPPYNIGKFNLSLR
jgi:hypothetical protein